MKKIFATFFVFAIALALVAQPVLAGGDQMQGTKGEGEVIQDGPCLFGDDTPVGPLNQLAL